MEENQINEQQVQELASMFAGAVVPAAAQEPVTQYGEVPADKFADALKTLTGGAIANPTDVLGLIEQRKQAAGLEARYRELETKANQNPFASPLVAKMNDIVQGGGSATELQKFMQMQSLDVDGMSEADAYKTHLSMKYPTLNADEIEALVSQEFPLDDEGKMNLASQAQLKLKGIQAKDDLRAMKVAAENPQALQQRQAAEQRAQMLGNGWKQVLGTAFWNQGPTGVDPKFAYKVEMPIEGAGQYTLDYKFSKDALEKVMPMAVQYAVQNGIDLNAQGASSVMEVAKNMAIMADFNNFLKTILTDMHSSVTQSVVRKSAGNVPAPAQQGKPPDVPKPSDGRPPIGALLVK